MSRLPTEINRSGNQVPSVQGAEIHRQDKEQRIILEEIEPGKVKFYESALNVYSNGFRSRFNLHGAISYFIKAPALILIAHILTLVAGSFIRKKASLIELNFCIL